MSHIDDGELTAYADGAYSRDSAEAQQIAAHLASCANCRNRLADAQALSGRASEILAFAAPERIVVPALPQPKRARTLPLAWAATVVLAVGLGWLLRGEAPRTTQQVAMTPAPAHTQAQPQNQPQLQPQKQPQPQAPAKARSPMDRTSVLAAANEQKAEQQPQREARAGNAQALAAAEAQAKPAFAAAPPAAPAAMPAHYISDLPVVSVDGPTVIQRLPDGVLVSVSAHEGWAETKQLRNADVMREGVTAARAVVQRDRLLIEVQGPLPLDSLKALLKRVR